MEGRTVIIRAIVTVALVFGGLLLLDRCAGRKADAAMRAADTAKGEAHVHAEQGKAHGAAGAAAEVAIAAEAPGVALARQKTAEAVAILAARRAAADSRPVIPAVPSSDVSPGLGSGHDDTPVAPGHAELDAARDAVIENQAAYIAKLEGENEKLRRALTEYKASAESYKASSEAWERRAHALEIVVQAKKDAEFSHDLLTGGKGAVIGALAALAFGH